MAIIIGTGGSADRTYNQLKSDVANWMNRTDLDEVIPSFISLAEARISGDLRVRQMIVSAALTFTPGLGAALPPGWLEFKSLEVNGCPLSYMTPDELAGVVKSGGGGQARWFTIDGSMVQFGPEPSGVSTIDSRYYRAFDPLSQTSTNWLLSNKPNLYLYAALAEGCLYIKKPDEAASWAGLYNGILELLRGEDARASYSGSTLRTRRR